MEEVNDSTNDVVNNTEIVEGSTDDVETTKKRKKGNNFLIFILVFLVLTLAVIVQLVIRNYKAEIVSSRQRLSERPKPVINKQENEIEHDQPDKIFSDSEEEEKITHLLTVPKSETFYYLSEGNIWRVELDKGNIVSNKLFFDYEDDIVEYDVSPSGKYIGFSIRKHDYEDILVGFYDSDTTILKDMVSGDTKIVYEIDNEKDYEISSLRFTSDEKSLVVSNNSIWVYGLEDNELKSFALKPKRSHCRRYSIKEFSPDNKYVLVRMWCYEGGWEEVIDLNNGETIHKISMGYATNYSRRFLHFIDNESVMMSSSEFTFLGKLTDFAVYSVNIFSKEEELIKEYKDWEQPISSYVGKIDDVHYYTDLYPNILMVYDAKEGTFDIVQESLIGLLIVDDDKLKIGNINLNEMSDNNESLVIGDIPEEDPWLRVHHVDVNE